jgi:hypothetical protein
MDSISGFSEDMEVVNSSYSIHLMHAVSNLHSAARVLYVALGLAGCVFFGVFLAGQGVSHAALWATVLAVPLTAVGTIASVKAAAGTVQPVGAVTWLRDEEAAGSNPATPTRSQGTWHTRDRCPGGTE